MNRIGRFAVVALAVIAATATAHAADIRFLCAEALQSAMDEVLADFRTTSGHTVTVRYANIGRNVELLHKGEEADLVIVSPQQWNMLQKEGLIDSTIQVVIGKVGIGLFVRKGAARPDVTSVDAFKQALRNARSIAVRDPEHGSPVGVRTMALLERVGIASEIKAKLVLTVERPFEAVIEGEAEIGFSSMTEIADAAHVELVGPVPTELQNFIIFTAAVPTSARQAAAAKELLAFFNSDRAATVFRSKGIAPR
jgi:molybdate transport system substrate-binding protein